MAFRIVTRAPVKFPLRPRSPSRFYHDYVRFSTPGGIIRIPLNSPKVIGVASSRGNRANQEDFYAYATLTIDPEELRADLKKVHKLDWNPDSVGRLHAQQAVYIGLFDGHGGSAVSQYLRQELHGILESARKENIPDLYAWIKDIGGYFKRFRGGALAPWIQPSEKSPLLDLEGRLTQAFFEIDRNLSWDPIAQTCGATASVVLLQALDEPTQPFFSAQKVAITVGHCGDTRVLLCSTDGGQVFPMTENHHPDAHVETIRLRRTMGSSLITDSFGESRWMGALANTRCLGDLKFKRFGVTPEPEVRTKLVNGKEWAYMVLVSDGVSSMMSDGEVVDLARGAPDPKSAAERILRFAQELGGEDNATALVVPFAGWGTIRGPDKTKELRDYRQKQAEGSERQRRM